LRDHASQAVASGDKGADGVEAISSLKKLCINRDVPMPPGVGLFDHLDCRLKGSIILQVGDDAAWARFEKYLVVTRPGIIAILGFAGSGKTQLPAVVAQLYMVPY